MHEVGPQRLLWLLVASVSAVLSAVAFPHGMFQIIETEQVERILMSGLLAFIAGASLFASVFRLPRLCWTDAEIVYTTQFYRSKRLSWADFGPLTPYTTYTQHGIKTMDFLLLRPVSGGKIVHFALPCYGLTKEELSELADRMNRTRGMPFGSTDTQAILETLNKTGLVILVLLLFVPVVLVFYLLLG